MDTGRLGEVRRHENSNRKFMCILNNMIKSRWEVVDDSLSRERNEMDVRLEKAGTLWRRKHVQQRVLLQCLKMRKESLAHSNARRYGSYGGKPLFAFNRDMDKFISENHPKKRRQRKVRQALLESIERGKIIAPEDIPKKVDKYFNSWKELEKKDSSSKHSNFLLDFENGGKTFKNTVIPPIRGLLNSFHKFTLDESQEEESAWSVGSQAKAPGVVGPHTEGRQLLTSQAKDQGMIAPPPDSMEKQTTDDTTISPESSRTVQQTTGDTANVDRQGPKPSNSNRRVLKLPPVQTSKAMISLPQA